MFKKESSNISKSAVKLIADEMEYINGGAIRVERYGFLEAESSLVIAFAILK